MPQTLFRERVESLTLDLLWSLWVELGASGWARRHPLTAIDVEPLIGATAQLVQSDARLLQEALAWSVTNVRLVSVARFRNLVATADDDAKEHFGKFAAAVNKYGRATWPAGSAALELRPAAAAPRPDLARPALLQLRLRALFGVSARAEVTRLLISEPTRYQTVSELTMRAEYGRDNIADTLESLRSAGIVEVANAAKRTHYRLTRPDRLAELIGPMPAEYPDWVPIFRIVAAFMRFARTAPADPIPRAGEVASILREVQPHLARVGLMSTLRATTGPGLVTDFESWAVRALSAWAHADQAAVESPDEATYSVHRLDFGGYGPYQGWIHEPGAAPRPIEMPELAGLYLEHPRSDFTVDDDSRGAPNLAHILFENAFRRVPTAIGPFLSNDATNQFVAQQFANDHLRSLGLGASATFTESFLRNWYTTHRDAITKNLAAVRQGSKT